MRNRGKGDSFAARKRGAKAKRVYKSCHLTLELQLDMQEVETAVGAPRLKAPRLDRDLLPFSLQRLPRVEPVEPLEHPVATRISLKGLGAFTT